MLEGEEGLSMILYIRNERGLVILLAQPNTAGANPAVTMGDCGFLRSASFDCLVSMLFRISLRYGRAKIVLSVSHRYLARRL